ncbi:uncharacterized protein N0V89_007364 [Didymosphaeria variabile]|uniref:Rhodopsin domain-containing protein n=1 Tax=Didymosphaeria variabile TaxID=1932322 RepID=A0A9W8XIQ9_9PLEO|nr:uncharacterized protein N0V89_007364 [Didymosphaeria variabile]KAJ4352018.1 hypothetical protein N0V89_007364 [Didymosphaeria variabile]
MATEDFAGILNGVMWTQVVLAVIFIGMRLYTRYFLIQSLGWDDLLMIVNLITFIGYVGFITVGLTYGIGRKRAAVDPADYSKAIMLEAIGQGICIMGIAASKASVAVFLLRIVIFKWHKALLWFCIVSTTILCTITTTLLFLQCRPAAFLWDPTIEGGVCWLNFTHVGLSMGAWSAAMDFILAILPWHIIMGLNMKRKEKLTVAFGLSLGVFAGICSIVRTYELQSLSSLEEYVYDTVPMLLWSSTEVFTSIICACIPILRPLYVRIVHGSKYGLGSSGRAGHSYPLKEYAQDGYSQSRKDAASGMSSRVYAGASVGVWGLGLVLRQRLGWGAIM